VGVRPHGGTPCPGGFKISSIFACRNAYLLTSLLACLLIQNMLACMHAYLDIHTCMLICMHANVHCSGRVGTALGSDHMEGGGGDNKQ
jgi:hypothetical protein